MSWSPWSYHLRADIEDGKAQSRQHSLPTFQSSSASLLHPGPLECTPLPPCQLCPLTGLPQRRLVGTLLRRTSYPRSSVPMPLVSVFFSYLLAPPMPNCPIFTSPASSAALPGSPLSYLKSPVMSKRERSKGYFFLIPIPTGMAWVKESLALAAPSALGMTHAQDWEHQGLAGMWSI